MQFILLRLGNHVVHHGYTADNQEVVTEVQGEPFREKLVSVDRILSVSEKYVLLSSAYGRVIYFEYDEDFHKLCDRLQQVQHQHS